MVRENNVSLSWFLAHFLFKVVMMIIVMVVTNIWVSSDDMPEAWLTTLYRLIFFSFDAFLQGLPIHGLTFFFLGSMSAPVGWCLLSYSLGILAAGSQVLMHFCTLKRRTSWITTHPHCQARIPRHWRKGACGVVTEAQSQVGPARWSQPGASTSTTQGPPNVQAEP